jgi:hypothetical protein
MTDKRHPETEADRDLAGSAAALRRAALNARALAQRTGTPLVFLLDGKVEKRFVTEEPPPAGS